MKKRISLAVALAAALLAARSASAQTGYFCNPEPEPSGWTICWTSGGAQLDCMEIAGSLRCIKHQDWGLGCTTYQAC